MTRGTIVLLTHNTVIETCEFNGDMYPDKGGCGYEIIEAFKHGDIDTIEKFKKFIKDFNNSNYHYEESELFRTYSYETYDLSKIHSFCSDYIYIVNEGFDEAIRGDWLEPQCLGIVTDKLIETIHRIVCTSETEARKKAHINLIKKNIINQLDFLHDYPDCLCTNEEITELLDEIKENYK